jgi:hypothetical protein
MRTWYGTLTLLGTATRGNGGAPGKEVHCRVVVSGDTIDLDIQTGTDALGNPRWRVGEPREIEPRSMLRALAMTQPEAPITVDTMIVSGAGAVGIDLGKGRR